MRRRRLARPAMLAATLCTACIAGEPLGEDEPGDGDDNGDSDGDAAPDPEPDDLAVVSHDRELRGMWIATVSNINFPSRMGLPAEQQKTELVALLDAADSAGLNSIFFQVRPEGDAFYESSLEPWSRYLTGTQGQDPDYDPLAFAIEEAHARNLELHAWLNPYRAKANASSTAVAPHASITMPEQMRDYDGQLWMDPGSQEVRDHTSDVIIDLVGRYDIDGVHFDDYFYPYPDGTEFPDTTTYDAYVEAGGTLARDDWRRDNVNRLIERVSAAIADERPHVRFGISPFGIYRPGIPEGIEGLDQYASLFADPVTWMQNEWVDYLAPQLYWPSTQPEQDYGTLLAWWSSVAPEGHHIFAGNYLSMLGTEDAWSVDEFRQQLVISRAHRDEGSRGNIFYNARPLREDRAGINAVLSDEFYAQPALTPPVALMQDVSVDPPTLATDGTLLEVSHPDPESLRAFVVYRHDGDAYAIDRIASATTENLDLPPGRWAISAAGRHSVESRAREIEI